MKTREKIYEVLTDDGDVIEVLDLNDHQCAGISGAQPINEACGGCVGCLLAQAVHYNAEIRLKRD